ncbi:MULTISPECIES: hypothetical protein [unclassified Pseudoalteromonas]|uniref:hypothetical protein n=1 Tax=unclassified Pseudoalteromonas TaxID=194690 RepID=UPI000465DF61|nr:MULTISPECIES: hypothetical protein [unclassified Pseudoalteromonas]
MASLHFRLAQISKGPILRHRTVGHRLASKRMHIYFSIGSRQRFIMTEEKTKNGRKFTELKEDDLGKSLIQIEGECELKLGINENN